MKKIFAQFLILFMVITLIGCENPKDPLEEFLEKVKVAENYEMSIVMELPLFGKVKMVKYVDGNKTHTASYLSVPEIYTELIDGVTYEYKKDENQKWVKSVKESPTENSSNLPEFDSIKFEDFNLGEDGKYTIKADKKATYEVESLTVELLENGAIIFMEKSENGMVITATCTISKFGEVTVTLPTIDTAK